MTRVKYEKKENSLNQINENSHFFEKDITNSYWPTIV